MAEKYLEKAMAFAKAAHGDQKYGDKPYLYHLLKVAKVATRYGGNEFQTVCCLLHDVLGDTDVSFSELAKAFSPQVAVIVGMVTNKPSKEETFKIIRENKNAVFVKLCDRIANCEAGNKNNKYKKEYPIFKKILYRPGEFEEMWKHLNYLLTD